MKKIALYRFINRRLNSARQDGRIHHTAKWWTIKLQLVNILAYGG
jgi:hypothetical protein